MNPSPYPAPFVSAHGRARIVKILLIAGAVASGTVFLGETLSLAFPPVTDELELADNPTGAVVMLVVLLLSLVDVLIYLTTVVFFCVWLYRAADNLRAFNPWHRPDHSPGWAVGSFFIPFVNLVIPYRAVKEVWQKSGPPDELRLAEPGPPARFPLWWMFWLLASITSNISMRMAFNENVPESTATMVSMAASALSMAAAAFAYLVVDAIDKKQEETSRKVNLGRFPGPPPPPTNLPSMDVVPAMPGPTTFQQS